jgi:hypothetical protein
VRLRRHRSTSGGRRFHCADRLPGLLESWSAAIGSVIRRTDVLDRGHDTDGPVGSDAAARDPFGRRGTAGGEGAGRQPACHTPSHLAGPMQRVIGGHDRRLPVHLRRTSAPRHTGSAANAAFPACTGAPLQDRLADQGRAQQDHLASRRSGPPIARHHREERYLSTPVASTAEPPNSPIQRVVQGVHAEERTRGLRTITARRRLCEVGSPHGAPAWLRP